MICEDSEEYKWLYTDEFGDDVGLDEVQLCDPPIVERVPKLEKLLDSHDVFLSYQAALVLAAWGNEPGLDKLESFIDSGALDDKGFSPDRFSGEDTHYDDIGDAVYIYGLSDGCNKRQLAIYSKLLALYPAFLFNAKFKRCLLKLDSSELNDEVIKAYEVTLKKEKYYQASQLLPVIAKFNHLVAERKIDDLMANSAIPNKVAFNFIESMEFCSVEMQSRVLEYYAGSTDKAIAAYAAEIGDKIRSL